MKRLLSSMLMSMVVLSALSQSKGERPTLVVGIVIDQLRSDYIELLQAHFGQHGFNRLINEGAYFENVDFNISQPDLLSGTAIIFTGAYPNVNGIPGSKIFNTKKRFTDLILNDATKIGNFTSETFSPTALTVSTLADEMRINSNGLSYVYAIAPDAQQAILMAGHAGNSAFWINDINGNWASTTYYKDMPSLMQARNYSSPLSSRLDSQSWTPSIDINSYPDIPTHRKFYPFKYIFGRNDIDRYRAYKQSALVNEEVTSVALEYLKNLNIGKRGPVDMLNIAYTTAPFEYGIDADYRLELQDTYIKLDAQLERLFTAIDKSVGRENAIIFISSTGYFNDNRIDDQRFNVPTGEFHPARAKSLLNMYLMAVYGNGEWIAGYDNQQIFLNRELIKERNKDIVEIRRKSCEFLRQMSGIAEAYSLDDIINNPVSDNAKKINRGTTINYAGDLFLTITPGWQIVNEDNSPSKLVRANAVNTPAFILAPQIKAQKITSIVDASFLAPTVARILRIRSPNAASHKPISL